MRSSNIDTKSVIVKLWVTCCMVCNTVNLRWVWNGLKWFSGINKTLQKGLFWHFLFLDTKVLIRVANDSDSSLSVSTKESQTSWKNNDFVTFNVISFGSFSCNLVKMSSPVFVSNSWSSKSGDFNFLEKSQMVDIDVWDDR